MRRLLTLTTAAAFALALAAVPVRAADKPAEKGPAGFWLGTLKVGAVELRLGLVIEAKGDDLTGKMDSLDQGAKDIPLDEVTFKDGKFAFAAKKLTMTYEGTLSDDGQSIKGDFTQGALKLPLTFKRTETRTALARPQEPKRPYPYVEEEVSYENAKAGVKFAGTFTKPKGDGPFPAVLLITGSGPQDRDESLMGHKPFLVLADHLTRKGVAVLRVDDRGVGGTTGDLMKSTEDDLAEDVLAGVAYLKGRKDVRPDAIGLVGHSEGGILGPMAASRSKDVAFVVMLAGTGLPGDEVMALQLGLVMKAEKNSSDEEVAKLREKQKKVFALVREEKDPDALAKKLEEFEKEEVAKMTEEEKKEYEKMKGLAATQAKMVTSPWFRSFLLYDPRPVLAKVTCPVLALNGGNDVQVAAKENLAAVEKALKEGGNKDVTVKELAGLNHLFQHSKTGAVSEYGKIDETFAPEALEEISDWILKRTKR